MNVLTAEQAIPSDAKTRKPGWRVAGFPSARRWVPLAVLLIAITVATVFVSSRAAALYAYDVQIAHQAAPQGTAPQRSVQMPSPPLMTQLIRSSGQVMVLLLSWLFWSCALLLSALLLPGDGLRAGNCVAIVVRSWLPYALRAVLQWAYMLLTHDPIFNPGLSGLALDSTPPAPGALEYTTPTRAQPVWSSVLSQIDIYLFLQVGLFVQGVVAATGWRRRRVMSVAAAIVLFWLLLAAVPGYFDGFFNRIRFW